MDRTALCRLLEELLQEVTGEARGPFSEEQSLQEQLRLDSVDLVALAVEIHARLRVDLDSRAVGGVRTVGDLLDVIQQKLQAQGLPSAA